MSEETKQLNETEATETSQSNTENQIQALNDQVLRAKAELENYKKVQSRNFERTLQLKTNEKLKPLLDIMSELMLIQKYTESETSLKEALEIIQKKINKNLKSLNISPVGTLNEQFDSRIHEAIMQIDNPEYESNTVIDVIEYGWIIDNECITPAKVTVSK